MPEGSGFTIRRDNLFHPKPPSNWERFRQHPTLFIARWLYTHQAPSRPPQKPTPRPIKTICLSDTHNEQPTVPNGDILIHSGDLTINGSFAELASQLHWLDSLPHTHKIVVAGNHDLLLDQSYYQRYPNKRLAGPENDEKKLRELHWGSITYLARESATLDIHGRSLRIYGSPMTPEYGNWAYQYLPVKDIWKNTIPLSTDVLVTHGPAKGHVDLGAKGCEHLNREVWRVKPRLHVCGHIHVARGVEHVDWGWLQWGYDTVVRGEERVFTEVIMFLAWVVMWVRYFVFGPREMESTFVNAAVAQPKGVVGGDETMVVEL